MSTYEFNLPDVGEGLSEGEIVKWHIAVGDTVKADQIIVDVQTDKAIVEIPAPVSGTITALGGMPNDVIPIGALLVSLETDSDNTSAASAATISADSAPAAVPPASAQAAGVPSLPRPGRALASPATRKLARSLGLDLTTIEGTGSRGQVTRQDVEQWQVSGSVPSQASGRIAETSSAPVRRASARPAVAGEDTVEPLKGLRRQVAQSMQEAWSNVPHIFSMDDLDATELVRARNSVKHELAPAGIKISYMPFLIKACVAALEQHPRFNASLDMVASQIIYRHRFNIGIATATPEGLTVTVVHDAERKSIAEIAEEIASLAALARTRKISLAQLSGGTFTISNYGSYGGMMGTPIIRPPQVAIAGFGRLHEAVVPLDGVPAIRMRLPFCVATDHRLNDGEHLGAFIDVMSRYLADPVRLLGRATWS
jgi:pyruvate dehydrogenase E2 component (dihydrolipoamide acetyltransferase)